MQIHEFKTEKEWLDFRKQHVCASDMPIILGEAKWKLPDGRVKTPFLLWQEKLGLFDLSCDNVATRYGKSMEEPARQAYNAMIFDKMTPAVITNKKYPNFMASLDGLSVTRDRAVEIKNANAHDHALAKEGKVPKKYYAQLQTQLLVTELPMIDYFSMHQGEGIIVPVERNDDYIELIKKKGNAFWELVLDLKEPEMTDDDYVERNDAWGVIAKGLWDIKEEIKGLEKEKKRLEQLLKEESFGCNSRHGNYRFTVVRAKGGIDYSSIPELEHVNLEKYRKPQITKWLLNFKTKLGEK